MAGVEVWHSNKARELRYNMYNMDIYEHYKISANQTPSQSMVPDHEIKQWDFVAQ